MITPVQFRDQDTVEPFFELSPAKLAGLLSAQMGSLPDGSSDIYRDALLYNVAHTAVATMHHQDRTAGALAARYLSPISSMGRVGRYESALYDGILKGNIKADDIPSLMQPQILTYTAHPNFSRTPELTQASRKLATALGKLDRATQQKLSVKGAKLEPLLDEIDLDLKCEIEAALKTIKGNLQKPRDKRTREDELKETTLDMIPVAMDAATEQFTIIKQRMRMLDASGEELQKPGGGEWPDLAASQNLKAKNLKPWAKDDPQYAKLEGKGAARQKRVEARRFTLEQLDAMAAMLPTHNSWFLDGDGKRTVHTYDADVAIPAIKRATYEGYVKLLEQMGESEAVTTLKNDLQKEIKQLTELETLAAARMDAFNKMHEADKKLKKAEEEADPRGGQGSNEAIRQASQTFEDAKSNAQECRNKYRAFLEAHQKLLTNNIASKVTETVGKLIAENTFSEENQRGAAENLYIQAKHFGNYAVRLQRRENAGKYKEVFVSLFKGYENHKLREYVFNHLKSTGDLPTGQDYDLDYMMICLENSLVEPHPARVDSEKAYAQYTKNQKIYRAAVKAFSEIMTKNTAEAKEARKSLYTEDGQEALRHYVRLSNRLGRTYGKGGDAETTVTPLNPEDLLAYDALGIFNRAAQVPEAFAGGFVIAEAGQPTIQFMQQHKEDPTAVQKEVAEILETDMSLQTSFARLMKVPNVEIIPLHEDPATLIAAPAAQEAIRSNMNILDHILSWVGLGPSKPEKRAPRPLKYLTENGTLENLSAYDYLRMQGISDEEMGTDIIEDLKKAHVLLGEHDMEACSDSVKRGGSPAAKQAEQSVRGKLIAAARHLVTDQNDTENQLVPAAGWGAFTVQPVPSSGEPQKYLIVRQKFLGQGGALARATNVPLDTTQATWQGEHATSFTPLSMAHYCVNALLGRFGMRHEMLWKGQEPEAGKNIIKPKEPTYSLSDLAHQPEFQHLGNILGLPIESVKQTTQEKDTKQLLTAMDARISRTRDDPKKRYEAFLKKYGFPAPNYSARPDGKAASTPDFSDLRAIGLAAQESGIYSNLIAFAEMFAPQDADGTTGTTGEHASKLAVERLREWRQRDPFMQQLVTSAKITANLVNLKAKWAAGDVTYIDTDITGTNAKVSKKGNEITIAELVQAYNDGQETCKGFDKADLVMAYLTDQYHRLVKGLVALDKLTEVKDRDDLLSLLPEAHREDMKYQRNLADRILEKGNEERDLPPDQKVSALTQLARNAYYLLHESGCMYHNPALMEKEIHSYYAPSLAM